MPLAPALAARHLLNRAGFGPGPEWIGQAATATPARVWQQLRADARPYRPLQLIDALAPDLVQIRNLSREEKKALFMQNLEGLKRLNLAWLDRMCEPEAQLREKMTFFWHDHFACRPPVPFAAQVQNNTLRRHALGNFGELLMAMAKDPAMLLFLNNQQNRRAHPNENFARELLELFTLGRGHYSETDIREAARAFTGWSTDRQGQFVFRPRLHDYGRKHFLGRSGNFGGEDIIHIILEQPQTARYLTRKLYRFLVNPEVDQAIADRWADGFYQSGYDIGALLDTIFSSEHFYAAQHLGRRIKSPVEYLVSLRRLLGLQFAEPEGMVMIQRLLGQLLFMPPSVAGWPEGTAWIDSSSLLTRLQLPKVMLFGGEWTRQPREAFAGNEDMIRLSRERGLRMLQTEADWAPLLRSLRGLSEAETVARCRQYLLTVPPQALGPDALRSFVSGRDRDSAIKVLSLRLLGSPEFQLC